MWKILASMNFDVDVQLHFWFQRCLRELFLVPSSSVCTDRKFSDTSYESGEQNYSKHRLMQLQLMLSAA